MSYRRIFALAIVYVGFSAAVFALLGLSIYARMP